MYEWGGAAEPMRSPVQVGEARLVPRASSHTPHVQGGEPLSLIVKGHRMRPECRKLRAARYYKFPCNVWGCCISRTSVERGGVKGGEIDKIYNN